MISGHSSRYLLSATPSLGVYRYDRTLRRARPIELPDGASAAEGVNGHFLVWRDNEGALEVEVRTVDEPMRSFATGKFDESWTFEGDNQRWANVDEYLLFRRNDRLALLHIADAAQPIPLDELGEIQIAKAIPGVKLVVLIDQSNVIVLDPESGRVGERLRLAGQDAVRPRQIAFRPEVDEMWVNSGATLVALDARKWEVVDAAGYEESGEIAFWAFVDDNAALVGRVDSKALLMLDLATMLPAGVAETRRVAIDATLLDETVYSVDATGRFERTRVRAL